MRILHVTDTHLGIDRWYRGAPRGWRRADDHLVALKTALAEDVDLVVHTGDLFDRSRPPARAVEEARRAFAAVRVPVVLLPGNHDRRGLAHHAFPGVTVVDRPARVDVAGVALAIVPWVGDAAAWTAAAAALDGDLLLCHDAFVGARVEGFTFHAGDPATVRAVPRQFRHVLCGHIHPRQVLRLGGATVVHPGSAERTSFAERGEAKGYAVWELGRTVTWRFVDLPARPMHLVHDEVDLDLVTPGSLVRVADPSLDDAVLARGGWVPPRKAPEVQLRLFG